MRTQGIIIILLGLSLQESIKGQLLQKCSSDADCKIVHSHCQTSLCICKPFFVQYNLTSCLPSRLLGQECVMNEQCTMKVAESTCSRGKCKCSNGFLRFRSHTCLSAARPGDVCFSNEHCKLWSKSSFCQFMIPNLIGRCACNSQTRFNGNLCFTAEGDAVSKKEQILDRSTESLPVSKTSGNNFTLTDFVENNKENAEEENAGVNEYIETIKRPLEWDPSVSDPFYDQRKYHLENNYSKVTVTTPTAIQNHGGNAIAVKAEAGTFKETNNTTIEKQSGYRESTEARKDIEKSPDNDKRNVEGDVRDPLKYLENKERVSVGLPCLYDKQCQAADREARCLNNVCDCVLKGNETDYCNGCHPETFQCRESGVCLSWFFVCDGRKDCSDGSDEECDGPVCSRHAFQCGLHGICVTRSAVCDGIRNCPNGEDELLCKNQDRCPNGSFQCKNGQCVPEYEFCNSNPACLDKSDEDVEVCGSPIAGKDLRTVLDGQTCPFRCKNGRCRSTAIMCSGRDGCGDNSDELNCGACRCPSHV